MHYDPYIHHRQSIRLSGYDYSQIGFYYVTICTHNRACIFGKIVNDKIILNELGYEADKCWRAIPEHFPHVALDTYIIMPNHVHGILNINTEISDNDKNISSVKSTSPNQQIKGTSKTLSSIVRGFKIGVTKWVRQNTKIKIPWQRGFYEHIIRNEDDLNMVREYILTNPTNWKKDKLHSVFGRGT